MSDIPGLLTPARVAAMLNVTTKTLRALHEGGRLPRVRIGAGKVRGTFAYDPADVEAFIRRRKDYGAQPKCPSTNRRRRLTTTTISSCEIVDFAALRAELKSTRPEK